MLRRIRAWTGTQRKEADNMKDDMFWWLVGLAALSGALMAVSDHAEARALDADQRTTDAAAAAAERERRAAAAAAARRSDAR